MPKPTTLLLAAILIAVLPLRANAAAPNPFARGTTDFTLSGFYTLPVHYSEAAGVGVTGGVGKYFFDDMAIDLEFTGMFANQPSGHDDTAIVGIGLLGRWHFARVDRWSLFFDGGGGVTYADHAFPTTPYEGTHFNFYGKLGLGASYQLKDREFVTGGARYFHMSNAQIHGRDQNPGYDAVQFWVGLMWTR